MQEENETLVAKLLKVEEDKAAAATAALEKRLEGVNANGGGRRASIAASALGDVVEDVSGEGWIEERAELEEMIEALKAQSQQIAEEKEDLAKALEEER